MNSTSKYECQLKIDQVKKDVLARGYPPELLKGLEIDGSIDSSIERALISEQWKPDKALTKVTKTLNWRKQEDIDQYLTKEVVNAVKRKAIRQYHPQGIHGHDKLGHPIWVERTGYINIDEMSKVMEVDDIVRHHVLSMEYHYRVSFPQASQAAGSDIRRLTVIHDLSNIGLHNIRSVVFQVIQKVTAIDESHYPDTIYQVYIVNAPFLFYGTWKLIEPFLSPALRKRVRILGSRYQKELLEGIDKTELPSFLGGTCECIPGQAHGGCLSSPEHPQSSFFKALDEFVVANNAAKVKKPGFISDKHEHIVVSSDQS